MPQSEKLLCVKEAAYFLNMNPETFRTWVKTGIVKPTVRIGQIYRFDREDLMKQLKERSETSPRYRSGKKHLQNG